MADPAGGILACSTSGFFHGPTAGPLRGVDAPGRFVERSGCRFAPFRSTACAVLSVGGGSRLFCRDPEGPPETATWREVGASLLAEAAASPAGQRYPQQVGVGRLTAALELPGTGPGRFLLGHDGNNTFVPARAGLYVADDPRGDWRPIPRFVGADLRGLVLTTHAVLAVTQDFPSVGNPWITLSRLRLQ